MSIFFKWRSDDHTIVIEHTSTKAYCVLLPMRGARLSRLGLYHVSSAAVLDLIHGISEGSSTAPDPAYKSAHLLPYPNRINNGSYRFRGRSYQLHINERQNLHALHGFIDERPFQLMRIQEDLQEENLDIEFRHSYDGSIAGFPFPFDIQLSYTFSASALSLQVRIINTGPGAMPMGYGWHPYFHLGAGSVNDWHLQLPAEVDEVITNDSMIPTGERNRFSAFGVAGAIGDRFFDTGFLIKSKADDQGRHVLRLSDPSRNIHLLCWQGRELPYVQLYTPSDRKTIAIEAMSCAADAFNNGMGLIQLSSGSSFDCRLGCALEK